MDTSLAQTMTPSDELPSPVDLATKTLSVFMDNIAPLILLGLGHLVVSLVAMAVLIPVAFGCMFGTMTGAVIIGAGLSSLGDVGEALGGLVAMVGFLGGYLGLFVVIIGGSAVVLSPFTASMQRAMDRQLAGEAEASFGGAFETAFDSPVRDILVTLGFSAAVVVGFLFLYIGALVPLFFLSWMTLAVHLDGLTFKEGALRSFHHAKDNLAWHLGIFGIGIVFGLVAGQIPLIGAVAVQTFAVLSYRAAFPKVPEMTTT